MGKLPACVGVPESAPVDESVSPAGSVPELRLNETGQIPPAWVKLWLKGELTVPVVTAGGVTAMVWQAMTKVYVALMPIQPLASVALIVMGKLPGCVGVPERTPPVESDKPVGSVPELIVK